MNSNLLQEIPEFLIDSIVYCDNLIYNKDEKSCLVLTKCLQFYEFRKKQCLHSIDLSNTCLAEIKANFIKYKGYKSKWYTQDTENESVNIDEVIIGKYIYNHFEVRKLYVLLFCWNKLIVLQRLNDESSGNRFQLETEFENVSSFKTVPSVKMKYQAVLKVEFKNSTTICTDFQKHDSSMEVMPSKNSLSEQRREFKQLHERLLTAKAELQLHKEITQRQFENLRERQTFGNNFVRSVKLDEKPMLSRCGDVWFRITCQDDLVLGVPLVNNCASSSFTTLKNLYPILHIERSTSNQTCDIIKYEHRLYQLQQTFDTLESIETFFQAEDIQFQHNLWVTTDNDEEQHIRPLSFVVLILKISLSQLTLIDEKCQLSIRFNVEKDLETLIPKTHISQQHLHIKTLNFPEILHQRLQHEIFFNEKTLHQDFLAVAMTSWAAHLQIDFVALQDIQKCQNLLAQKFDFKIVHRDIIKQDHDAMDVEEFWNDEKTLPSLLFYNNKSSSLWFGAMAKRPAVKVKTNDNDSIQSFWTFYLKNKKKTFLMLKLLFNELLMIKCNIVDIKSGSEMESHESKLANFEHAMRQELKTHLDLIKNIKDSNDVKEKVEMLMKLQLRTDIIAGKE